MQCRVKVLKDLEGVYPSLQPGVGKVYDALLHERTDNNGEFAVITFNNKFIVLRKGEFERVG